MENRITLEQYELAKQIVLQYESQIGVLKVGSIIRRKRKNTRGLTIGKEYVITSCIWNRGGYYTRYIINDIGKKNGIARLLDGFMGNNKSMMAVTRLHLPLTLRACRS